MEINPEALGSYICCALICLVGQGVCLSVPTLFTLLPPLMTLIPCLALTFLPLTKSNKRLIKPDSWLESELLTWWAQWTGVKCAASWGLCFCFFFNSLIVLCSETWHWQGFIIREGVKPAHFWGLLGSAGVCCAGCCGRFLRGNSRGGGKQGFTLSSFISYLKRPLQKPAPKTTESKGSSRGNNSAANSRVLL